MALAGILGLLFAIWPQHASVALLRVIAPGMNVGNVPAVDLTITPGDRVVAIGDPVNIEVAAPARDLSQAELEVIDSTGYQSRHKGKPNAHGEGEASCTWSFPAVMSDFRYRVHAGRAVSRYFQVAAVPRPKVEAVELKFQYPDYAGLKPRTIAELPQVIEALAGTRVTVSVSSNVPVARPRLLLAGGAFTADVQSPAGDCPNFRGGDDMAPREEPGRRENGTVPFSGGPKSGLPACAWTFSVGSETAGHGSLVLEDEHGICSEPTEFEIRAIADEPPKIVILEPAVPKITAKPRDRITIRYAAEDDFGLGEIEMLVTLDGGETKSVPQPFPEDVNRPVRACQGDAVLDLSQIELGQAARITVEMRANDTLPAPSGPNRALSKPLAIEIDRSAEPSSAQAGSAPAAPPADQDRKEAEKLQELAGREEQLAEQAAGQPPASPQDPKWREEQEKVARELADAVKHDPDAIKAALAADQKQARKIASDSRELSQEQQSLKQDSQALADLKADREQLRQAILDWLAQDQKAVEDQAAQLQADVKEDAKENETAQANALAAAKEEMDKTASDIRKNQAGEAAEAARKAEQSLEQAAAQHGSRPSQPEKNPTEPGSPTPQQKARAEKAGELAKSEENIAKALDAVNKGNLAEALARMQEGIEQKAEDLRREAQEMAARTEALDPGSPGPQDAHQAADQLREAERSAEDAKQALAQSPASAGPAQERTVQSLNRAAERMEKLGQGLDQKAASLGPPNVSPESQDEARELSSALGQRRGGRSGRDGPTGRSSGQRCLAVLGRSGRGGRPASRSAEKPVSARSGVRAAARLGETVNQGPIARPQPVVGAGGISRCAGQDTG